jgi:hypothetical protein
MTREKHPRRQTSYPYVPHFEVNLSYTGYRYLDPNTGYPGLASSLSTINMRSVLAFGVFASLTIFAGAAMPSFPLLNSAVAGLAYPAVGLGTGGYGLDKHLKYPGCWIDYVGCGEHSVVSYC